jgi:hypothetical protein
VKHYILVDKQIREVPLLEWARWYEATFARAGDVDDRRVDSTHLANVWVSTAFLGIDHRILDEGPPILFETMCFLDAQDGDIGDPCQMFRYCTWDEAQEGHNRIVETLRVLEADSIEITTTMLNIVRSGQMKVVK